MPAENGPCAYCGRRIRQGTVPRIDSGQRYHAACLREMTSDDPRDQRASTRVYGN